MEKHLTKREIEIIEQISIGMCSKEISKNLFISVRTVETHRKNIKQKLGFNNFYSVISYAYKNDILPLTKLSA